MATGEYWSPPAGAPALLSTLQLVELCQKGYLEFSLPLDLVHEIDDLQADVALWFDERSQMPAEARKLQQYEEEGYYTVPGEKEYLTFRRATSPSSHLETNVSKVWTQSAHLLHRVLCDLSRASGLDETAWDNIVDGALDLPVSNTDLKTSTSLLRLFRYEPDCGIAEKHTDLGLLTLCVGTGPGLEVLEAGEWRSTTKCTILVGECLRRLSGNSIRAGIHRVVGIPQGRQSLVFALRPNLAAHVDMKRFGSNGTVSLQEVFLEIKGSKYNVNATKDIRERQRQDKREHLTTQHTSNENL